MNEHKINGHIIHMNSTLGHFISPGNETNLNVYPASKFAVTALSESLRHELRMMKSKTKITVTILGLFYQQFKSLIVEY